MATNWVGAVSTALPAVIPLATAVFAASRGPGTVRERLKHDVELLEKLPEESAAKTQLLQLIAAEVIQLRQYNSARRDLGSMAMALVTAPLVWYLTVWIFQHNAWWAVPAALLTGTVALALTYGIFESAERVPRNEKGRRIPIGTLPGEATSSRPDGAPDEGSH